jgi:hypothetical protein
MPIAPGRGGPALARASPATIESHCFVMFSRCHAFDGTGVRVVDFLVQMIPCGVSCFQFCLRIRKFICIRQTFRSLGEASVALLALPRPYG